MRSFSGIRPLSAFRRSTQIASTPNCHHIQFHINTSRARIGETLEYLTDTAGFLAGLPGPKTLIYISDGLALAPGDPFGVAFVGDRVASLALRPALVKGAVEQFGPTTDDVTVEAS